MTKNDMGQEHRICKECWIEHIENCTTCFGFGLKNPKDKSKKPYSPITAAAAKDKHGIEDYVICPECHGTPFGIKKGVNT